MKISTDPKYNKYYDSIHSKIMSEELSILEVYEDEDSHTDGYHYKEDIIRIYLSEYDRTDKEDYSKILQTWKGLILHETIHEYQHKIHPEVIKKDKQIIDDLLDERKKQELTVIRDNDHDLVFYQSLFEVSKILNHNLERLIDQIV